MLHKFVDCHIMVIIEQIKHIFTDIKILFEDYLKVVSYFRSHNSISHIVHAYRQLLSCRNVLVVSEHALGLSLPIFH